MDCDYDWQVQEGRKQTGLSCQGAHMLCPFWDEEMGIVGSVIPRRIPLLTQVCLSGPEQV